jgi:replicative DNA helicase Mcm
VRKLENIISIKQRLKRFLQLFHQTDIEELQKSNKKAVLEIEFYEINDYFIDENHGSILDQNNFFFILSQAEEEINKDRSVRNWISIKIVNINHNAKLRELDTDHIGNFISTTAMVKNITPIQARIKRAIYECRGCMRLHEIQIPEGSAIITPSLCVECGGKSFRLLSDESEFIDCRFAKLEEPLELRQAGITREFKAYMDSYLASPNHVIKPGDVCEVSGIFDVVKNEKTKDWEFLFKLHNIKPQNSAYEEINLSESDIKEIEELAYNHDIFKLFVNSLAPNVYGYEEIKEGIVLQLFEGDRPKDDVFKSENVDRWIIHILLIGDPGIGKSKLVKEVSLVAPKGINVSGTGSTQAGLTASAVKDELTGSYAMEAGAFVLADSGILTIDEFDKLNSKVQKSLNEPLEQLTVSTAKAGLVQTMSARTSLLAAANPKFSKWDKYESIHKQLDIPDSTLSRFDLIYIMEDKIDEDNDRELSTKILQENYSLDNNLDVLEVDLLKKYITYAKSECHPVLTPEAEKAISDFYVETRKAALSNDDSKPITLRELLVVKRLSIARAKVELREYVELRDALEAIRIYKYSLNSLGLDPTIAGELQNVKSDREIEVIKKAESLIKENQGLFGFNLNDDIVDDIKSELKVLCNGRDDVVDDVYDEAFKNITNNG